MNLSDFKEGDRVTYIPLHAKENVNDNDWERGIVSSVGRMFVFVRFYSKIGLLGETAQATDPNDLVKG